jgi:hypothetical protein
LVTTPVFTGPPKEYMKFIFPSSFGFLVFFRDGATAAFLSSAIRSVLDGVGLLLAEPEKEEEAALYPCLFSDIGEGSLVTINLTV